MGPMRALSAACSLLALLQLDWLGTAAGGVNRVDEFGGLVPVARPPHTDYARVARWLVHRSDWGVVSTQSTSLPGFPYGNAVAISDGPLDRATGWIFFYLTGFDQTAIHLAVNPKSTLSLCEAQLPEECKNLDPEDPRCTKLTIAGEILKVPEDEIEVAKELMFRRHRQMRDWHVHKFTFYEMHIGNIKLLDYYGGYNEIKPDDYFASGIVLEEMKSDPCWKFPHRFYCVEDRWELKKEQAKKRVLSLASQRRPEPTNMAMQQIQSGTS